MRRNAPATERNRDPILGVLERVLPSGGEVLEIASGTGQHARYFAEKLDVTWRPTDPDPAAVQSITAWREDGPGLLLPPRRMAVEDPDWPEPVDGVVCINMIHISPWEATEALFAGAARVLSDPGVLVTYGPYRIDGQQTSESNVRFEAWLHSLDPRFGVRDMADLQGEARRHGLVLDERVAMPANNFTLVFRRE